MEQIIVTTHLTHKMPLEQKIGPNCNSFEEGSSNGISISERAIEVAQKGQWRRLLEKGDNGSGSSGSSGSKRAIRKKKSRGEGIPSALLGCL